MDLPAEIPSAHVGELPREFREAWTAYMINGFQQNERMFMSTLEAFMKPYRLTVWLYAVLFGVGMGLFAVGATTGLTGGSSLAAVSFGGLSVTMFVAFFLRRPLDALEQNLEFITWLGVAFNTYWTRLMYITDVRTVQDELKEADDDFRESVERLISQHAALRGRR